MDRPTDNNQNRKDGGPEGWVAVAAGVAVFVLIAAVSAIHSKVAGSTVSVAKVRDAISAQVSETDGADIGEGDAAAAQIPDDIELPKSELATGLVQLEKMERRDPAEIEREIQRAKREEQEKELLAYYQMQMDAIENGTIDVWPFFQNSYILGDSRSEGFIYYGYLTEEEVYAYKGANLRGALDGLEKITYAQPWRLYFNYGTNDADGNWMSTDLFIERYEEVIETYRQALPDADIYVCSIMPVTEKAVEEDPMLENIPVYDAAVRELCEKNGYTYIDCNDLIEEHEDLYEPDGIHFRSEMCEIWAARVLRVTIEEKVAAQQAVVDEVEQEKAESEQKTDKQILAEEVGAATAGEADDDGE